MIGQILSKRYKIIHKLGNGGCGITYLAEDQHMPSKPKCVVKKLQPTTRITQKMLQLFEREAKILESLGEKHNQLPSLFACFSENERFYIVMEFIDGCELEDEIYSNRQWSETQVIRLLQEILEILEFVHQNNVIHRDIKPSNIMRRKEDGKLVLIDFGVVKEVVVADEQTRATYVGSRGYMAPEQSNGISRPCNDVYAVGMLGIEALTREMPYSLPKDEETGEVIWRDRVSVSDSFAKVLEKMVCYEFKNRYQNAREALAALRSLQTPLPPDGHNSTVLQLSTPGVHNPTIEKYLNDFIKKYDQIDDFMQLRDRSVEDDKQSLSALYIEPKLSKEQTFIKIYERVRSENQPTRLIIIGSPGLGKSTFLQMIGVKFAKFAREEALKQNFQKWRIPVFIKLADYAYKYADPDVNPKPYKLHNYISELLTNNFFFQRSIQEIEEDLREGKYLLLLDALDEIGNDRIRQGVWDSIDSATNYSDGNSLITCRSAIAKQYQLQGASYTNELLELEEEQIIEYVRHINPLLGEEKTNKLEEQIKSNSQTKTILSNPLLLYMTVGYFKNSSELPSKLNVKLFANHLIKERPKRRGSHLIPENQRYQYFQSIALDLHRKKIQTQMKEIIVDNIKNLSRQLGLNENEAESYLNFLVEDIGLLEFSDERCGFIHFTFQEFFVASNYGEPQSNKSELIKAAITNPSWWLQVIVRYYNLSQDYQFLERLIDENCEIFTIGTMIAADCLIEVVTDRDIGKHNPALYNKLFERLKHIYCNSPYELQREQAWRRLKALGGAKVFSFIENELDADRSDIRQKAALAVLGEISTNESVRLLGETIDIYIDEEKPDLFLSAIDALIATRNNQAKEQIKNLFGYLIEEEENDLIKALVKQLASSNLLDYINILLEQLKQPDLPLWLQVIILTELGNPPDCSNVFPEVIDMFWHRLQSANANALQVEVSIDAIKFVAPDDMRNYVKSMLRQDNTAIVASAVRFFRYQQDTSVFEELIDLICNSQERKLQEEILATLVRIRIEYLKNPEEEELDVAFFCDYINEQSLNLSPLLREQVIVTLKEFDGENSFGDLSSKLNNPQVDPEIKVTIIKSLCDISKLKNIKLKGTRDLGLAILNHLENNPIEDETLLKSMVFLILKISNQSQVEKLLEFASPANNSWWVKLVTQQPRANSQSLNKEMKWLLGKALIDYLLENGCQRPHKPDVNKWIDRCISQDDTDEELASEAFKLKLHLSGEKLDILRNALKNRRHYICLAALENHHEFSPDELLRRLRDLLNNCNEYNDEVANKAIELLGKCGQQHEQTISETERILLRLLDDNRYKQKAFEALSKLKGLLDID